MPHYGFNVQWMYSDPSQPPLPPDEKMLDFMATHGFDFLRMPCNYRFWTHDFKYFEPDESILSYLDERWS